jgi:superfamily II DNA/RNA helicase
LFTDLFENTPTRRRAIHVDDIAPVVNYDLPHEAEYFIHRIGRAAPAHEVPPGLL